MQSARARARVINDVRSFIRAAQTKQVLDLNDLSALRRERARPRPCLPRRPPPAVARVSLCPEEGCLGVGCQGGEGRERRALDQR
jgi:hypothetical protein